MNPNFDPIHNQDKFNYCEFCGTPIPKSLETNCCDRCHERLLFQEVKDFIRANDVNEFQVAAHFDIPLRMVKSWIQEGRIEYKEMPTGTRAINNNLKCEKCGAPVTFGTLCTKCLKTINKNIQGYDLQKVHDDDKMFFLDAPADRKRKK